MKRLYLTCLLLVLTQTLLFAKDYNILSYGAKPDGKTLNTVAIQSAVNQAHADGGGRVIVPKGRFLSGSIVLKSGVELHLLKNAVLLGSTQVSDYLQVEYWKGLVVAEKQENIAITGKGTLDGQGMALAMNIDSLFYAGELDSADYALKERRPQAPARPQILYLLKCRNIRVTGVTLRNSSSWVQTYDRCRDITIDRIRVDSDAYWNNDGIDLIDCVQVRLTHSSFNSADDGICLKSYDRPRDYSEVCDSIYISDCTVRSSASAVKFGIASFGGFRNVVVQNIKVYDTFRSAIALEVVHGGTLENVLIQNIKAVNTGNALFIRLGERVDYRPVGTLKDVTIRNMKVKVPFDRPDSDYEIRGPDLPFFHNVFPASITGIPGHPVENVTLENIEIIYPGRGNKAYAHMPLSRLEEVPEEIQAYPEFSMFGELPAWGLYVRHVKGLTLNNIKVKVRKPDYRPAFVFDDVKDLNLQSIQVVGDDKAKPLILHKTASSGAEE